MELDPINKKIMEMLIKDSRRPYREIADELGVTESTVRKRVKKLVEDKVIERFTVALNPEKSGKSIIAYVVAYPQNQREREVEELVKELPEVVEAYAMSGKCGVNMKVVVKDLTSLNAFLEKLQSEPAITALESCIALKELKRSLI
ncbi:MAG: Lrp/AsnC family transcriptional regulator [Candidatus Freyarchaeota archaeon]|nr:Lrp/AsnC family transcriptional regulator [Candidatus Jordarchaeia archaeon]MBS7267773.1 Lrp/AsnC family transcriptional regulator [Candidatus Jordarchaeia archaeon]MBS7279127.1 Lrp/AsnC family transcriptional regulator [Candidatus Jordarchaeia archaeon]